MLARWINSSRLANRSTWFFPSKEPTVAISFWIGTNTDITEQKQSEERLARSAEIERHRGGLLPQVAESSRTINAVLSLESITRVLSEDARRILGTHVAITSTTHSVSRTNGRTSFSPPSPTS